MSRQPHSPIPQGSVSHFLPPSSLHGFSSPDHSSSSASSSELLKPHHTSSSSPSRRVPTFSMSSPVSPSDTFPPSKKRGLGLPSSTSFPPPPYPATFTPFYQRGSDSSSPTFGNQINKVHSNNDNRFQLSQQLNQMSATGRAPVPLPVTTPTVSSPYATPTIITTTPLSRKTKTSRPPATVSAAIAKSFLGPKPTGKGTTQPVVIAATEYAGATPTTTTARPFTMFPRCCHQCERTTDDATVKLLTCRMLLFFPFCRIPYPSRDALGSDCYDHPSTMVVSTDRPFVMHLF
jgi:hypothetical protein